MKLDSLATLSQNHRTSWVQGNPQGSSPTSQIHQILSTWLSDVQNFAEVWIQALFVWGFSLLKYEDVCSQCQFNLRVISLQIVPGISKGSMHVFTHRARFTSDYPELCVHLGCSRKETENKDSPWVPPSSDIPHRPWGAGEEDNETPVAFVLPHSLAGDDIPAGPSILLTCRAGLRYAHHNRVISASF